MNFAFLLDSMVTISSLVVTPFAQNCRVVSAEGGQEAVVIDPGGDVDLVLGELVRRSLRCEQIWLTHSHLDHCGGVARLKELTGAKLYGHPVERELRARVEDICAMYGVPPGLMDNCPEPEVYLKGGERVSLGSEVFEVLFTPGHSPGHLCFYHRSGGVLLAGDTLFQGSIGRTDLPGGEHGTLMRSIREKILTLPPETKVMSGHGPDTTVGIEAKTNPFIAGGMDD